MRIGYLVQQFPPEVGAGPARIGEMVSRWSRAGEDITVITAMPNRPQGRIHEAYRDKMFVEESWEGVRVLRSWLFARPGGGFVTTLVNNTSFAVTAAMHALASAVDFDVLVASSPPYFPLHAGALLARLRNIPLVLELRDLWPEYLVEMKVLRSRALESAVLRLDVALLRLARHVVTVTNPLRERIIAKGIPRSHVTVIANGVDPARYYPAVEDPPLLELSHGSDELLVGYLGNFGAGQALETVLEAARLLAEQRARVRFVLVGDGTEFPKINDKARAMNLPNLSILPAIAKETTRAFYNNCDACLVPLSPLPIFAGALPSKMFEIMACGRPVIASASGEVHRALQESGGGWCVPPGNPHALAESILRVVALVPSERAAIGSRGREYVVRHFHRDAIAAQFLDVLRSAAGKA